MRGFDRDLIRGGHYGQRSCEPRKKAEHMAAPTKPAIVKKALANAEPSTHGTFQTGRNVMEWFSQKTSIAGTQIPNWALVLGAVIVVWIIYRSIT